MAAALLSLALAAEVVLPPLSDANRFRVSVNEINDLLIFNCLVAERLRIISEYEPRWAAEAADAVRETHAAYRAWDLLRDAKNSYYTPAVRRAALWRLREMLGADNYEAGLMPPHVPLHRFQRR